MRGEGTACTGKCKGAPAVQPGSVAGGGFQAPSSFCYFFFNIDIESRLL